MGTLNTEIIVRPQVLNRPGENSNVHYVLGQRDQVRLVCLDKNIETDQPARHQNHCPPVGVNLRL